MNNRTLTEIILKSFNFFQKVIKRVIQIPTIVNKDYSLQTIRFHHQILDPMLHCHSKTVVQSPQLRLQNRTETDSSRESFNQTTIASLVSSSTDTFKNSTITVERKGIISITNI
ncbi:hypothetical protein AAZV13_20G049000 [Glycine max]